jgi:glycosyltransferase involved in cell wall biosynthesis
VSFKGGHQLDKKPLVSVCIPCFNGEQCISNTIQNVLNQTLTDFELIIVNDSSKDLTEEVILGFKDTRIKYYKNDKNLGMVKNWNKALSLANGEFIKLLCMDDLIAEDCLQSQAEALLNNSSVVVVTSNTNVIDSNNNVLMTRKNFKAEGVYDSPAVAKKSLALGQNLFGEPSVVMYRKDVLSFIDPYDEDFWYAPDWDFILRALTLGDLYFIDKTLASFRLSPTSQTSKIITKNKWLIMKEDMRFMDKHKDLYRLSFPQKSLHYIRTATRLVAKHIYLKVVFRNGRGNKGITKGSTIEYQKAV